MSNLWYCLTRFQHISFAIKTWYPMLIILFTLWIIIWDFAKDPEDTNYSYVLQKHYVVNSPSSHQPHFIMSWQSGRTWQPFVEGKIGHEKFCQARIYSFRDKCVVFARNRKFAKSTQWNMQYIPCNSALLAQEALFLTQKDTFFAQRYPKSA